MRNSTWPWSCRAVCLRRLRLPARHHCAGGPLVLRFGLSYRDVEELLAERGVEVDHVTVYRWVQRFTPLLADAARPCRRAVGDRWWVDETYVVGGGSASPPSACAAMPPADPPRAAGGAVPEARMHADVLRVVVPVPHCNVPRGATTKDDPRVDNDASVHREGVVVVCAGPVASRCCAPRNRESYALFDRCAVERAPLVRPAGGRKCWSDGVMQARRLGSPYTSSRSRMCPHLWRQDEQQAFPLVRGLWWACQDLNLGPHPET
jgi:hypothetical protein